MLKIFYDSRCPLCSAEMNHLKANDKDNAISLIDLHQENFDVHYPHINFHQAMQILHGEYKGNLLLGLAVTHRAWTLVGKGFWVAPLNWPVVKTMAHFVYLGIAKHRHKISHLFARIFNISIPECKTGACDVSSKHTHNRSK
ncbi:DUF393 domain-containing protein [Paraglaciecola aquimarina]|uniref:DUF393 domain-containing protein n=1 Tax=Paraglaciecola algarum TaxID=3050085 RepID=A0ABS9D868_9ALTE|nr:DUF393 domain-containing protein [Paraglaciecola sp. G1-23]MCF2948218.1 DUF393 domain-containing protein [Paraglaciecola sp. G1-23]